MSIVVLELKKIFKPVNIIVVIFITMIGFNQFIMPEIYNFKNSQPLKQINSFGAMLSNKYGSEIDNKEFEDLKRIRDSKEAIATEYLLKQPESKEAGINDYKDFYYGREQIFGERREYVDTKLLGTIEDRALFEENIYLFWELPIIEQYIDSYEHKEYVIGIDYYKTLVNMNAINRLKEIQESKKFTSPMNYVVHRNYDNIMFWENVIVIISIAIMISPIIINDNKNRVNYIQYSSKVGRNIIKKKIIAGLIATSIIVTVQLIVFFIVYKQLGTFAYLDTYINAIMSPNYFWFDLTFGQYIVVTVIILYIISLLVCSISTYISSKVNSHLSLIGIQIPILYGIIMMQLKFGTTYVTNIFYPKHTTLAIYITVFIVSVILTVYMIMNEIRRDIYR